MLNLIGDVDGLHWVTKWSMTCLIHQNTVASFSRVTLWYLNKAFWKKRWETGTFIDFCYYP